MSINNNLNNSSFISSLEKKGIIDLTKNFVRNTLYEKLKNNNIPEEKNLKLYPSNFNIEDQNLYTMFKLEYTLIDDFLIRTKLNYTHSIFNNEIKSIINPLIPFDDTELISLLGINFNELNSLRFKWNNSNNSSDQIKSTYLYHLLNSHTKVMKIDADSQTNNLPIMDNALYSPDIRVGPSSQVDLEIKMKNIEDKYNKKIKEGNDIFLIENKFKKYKDEIDKRYEEELKNEIERFKTVELSQMRIEENKKYLIKLEKLREEYQEEYNKKYEELKKLKNELEERELKLQKEYEERNMQLKTRYQEREKNLDYKENYLEKKYKNDIDISVQRIKFNEELNSLKESIINNDKENKKKKNEINPLINNEIDFMKKEIEEIKNNLINKQPYLKNNFIKQEEDKKININNNIKPSKESVINSLNNLVKNNNSNILNKSKSSNSPNGSGVYNNNKQPNKKSRRKILEELEQEEYNLNHQMREEFQKIINGDLPIFNMDKDEFNLMKYNNNYEINMNKYRPKEIYGDYKNYNNEDIKNNNYVNDKANDINNYYDKNNNNNINNNKNEFNNINNYNDINKNHMKEINKNINDDNNQNIGIKKNNIYDNKNNIETKINNNSGLFNNNNNINNSIKKTQNYPNINKNNVSNINKNIKDSSPQNNIGGYNLGGIGGIGGIGGYNFSSNNNNIYNYPIKSSNSGSVIEENIEGEFNQNIKKENSARKNNFMGSNRYQNETKNPIKEESESSGSNNNSKEINNKNNNIKNNINVNKSNKFNNYDYNEIIDVKNDDEIEENINYEASGNKDDLSDKKKMEMASISGIAKKQEVSESAGGFGGLFQLQSHAGGFGMNDKESYGDFELSKGKNNVNNKRGNEKQSKFNTQNQFSQKVDSGDIPEELSSQSGF